MLLITNDGRKLALDQRLVNPMLPDSDTGKVTACANNVYDIWQRTTPQRSTQMVFCDLSTPHNDGKFNVYDTELNYGVAFTYSYSTKVSGIYEYILNDPASENSESNRDYRTKMHGYKRSHLLAAYRYYGDDGDANTADDILTFKVLDTMGQTVCSYSTDSSEQHILGVNAAAYTKDSANRRANNRLAASTSSGQPGVNLLRNGGAEDSGAYWSAVTASTAGSSPYRQRYSFDTNAWGQTTAIKVSGSSNGSAYTGEKTLATYTYHEDDGTLAGMSYANGDSISYYYDMFDRLVKTVYNDTGRYIEYAYSADGALFSLTYKDANHAVLAVYHFEYDSLGRLIRSRQTNGAGSTIQRTEHLYDTANRLTAQSWMLGNRTFTERYVYDDPTTDNTKGDGSLKQMTTGTGATIDFTYDTLKRLQKETVKRGSTGIYNTAYAYRTVGGNRSSAQVEYRNVRLGSTISGTLIGGEKFSYDALGNITSIYETTSNDGNYRPKALYEYDSQNQLTKETLYTYSSDTATTGTATVYTYTYDTAGNISSETKTTGGTATTKSYTYGDGLWKDLLTKVGSTYITYDDSGNPLNWYNGKKTYTGLRWEHGRQLARLSVGGTDIHYEYDADGIRTKMSAGSTTYEYITQGGKLMRETATKGSTVYVMDFIYDNAGRPFSVKFSKNGGSSFTTYYYVLNLQGDVVKIIKADGTVMATYTYDAWGNLVSLINASGNDIVNSTAGTAIAFWNPLTYRGYIRDRETGFYYLQSRYYDPANHRFINADVYTSTDSTDAISCNMFAYCGNSPILSVDHAGLKPKSCLLGFRIKNAKPSTGVGGEEVIIDGEPYNYVTDYSTNGELEEYWFDKKTDTLQHSRHHSDHGNPKKHKNPHDHDWFDDDNNNHKPGPPTAVNTSFVAPQASDTTETGGNGVAKTVVYVAGGLAGSYILYQGIKWTLASLLAPLTGGASYAVAFATP